MEHDRVNLVGTNRIIRKAVLFEPKVKISNIGWPKIWFVVKNGIITEAYNVLTTVIREITNGVKFHSL